MGLISDFTDGIKKSIADIFKNLAVDNINNISNSLNDTFGKSTGEQGWAKMFLATHPADFTGSTDSKATTVWSTIETLCNNVVVPIGGFVLVIILLHDLIQMVMKGNNFKEFDDSIFIRWIIKAVCGVILISNVFYISTGIFSFGTEVCSNGLSTLFGTDDSRKLSAIKGKDFKAKLPDDIGSNIAIAFLTLIIYVAILAVTVVIIVTMASRIIEIFMYLGIAPIPMATLMNGEWGQIGKNWIRGMLALSFQGFFIIVSLGIFKTLYGNVIGTINNVSKSGQIIPNLIMLVGFSFALVFTILRSGSISKSIFNAS